MNLKDKLTGCWETKGIRLVVLVAYVVDLKKDGKVLIRPIYKNSLFDAIYTFVEFSIEGSWGATSNNELNLSLDKATWAPSRMADQILKTLKVQMSTDGLISTVASAFFRLIGLGPSGGNVEVSFVDNDTLEIGDLTLYRRR